MHDVAGANLDALALERASQVRERDLVAAVEPRDALERGDVDEHAARHERADVLDAELREPVALRELGAVVAVVEEIADADVAQTVELRADLADLGADDLVVIHGPVRAERPVRLRNPQAEMPRAEQRHARLVDAAELIDGAARHEALRLEHLLRP